MPPCLWSENDKGLKGGLWIPANTPMFSIKKNLNTDMGHFGEMASWQMRGVNFPEANSSDFKGECVRCNGSADVAKVATCCEDLYGPIVA